MNIYIKLFYISKILLLAVLSMSGQEKLHNPSFEDEPADATMPRGWFAASKGTTPDILPGYWGVYDDAADGDSYIGLINRSDGSSESLSQRFIHELEKGVCYQLGFYLAHSNSYTGYNTPIKLRIWVSTKKNKRQHLIYESKLIENAVWQWYDVNFETKKKMKYLILEAFPGEGRSTVKGNILIDGLKGPKICSRV